MSQFKFDLPIDDALPALINAMRDHRHAVLQAPPGAGKTTRVPIALHETGMFSGKILMLEPRRLAARAAAGLDFCRGVGACSPESVAVSYLWWTGRQRYGLRRRCPELSFSVWQVSEGF